MSPKPPSVAGANPGRTRHHNRQMVLGHVRDAGKIGRAEIARISGLSTQAVSNIIADLADDGLLQERGRVSSGRGLPAVQYALNPSGGYALGFEIRPDVVFTALLDLDGKTVFSDRVGLKNTKPEFVTGLILQQRDKALKKANAAGARLMGAGVVMPGPFGTTGPTDGALELPEWKDLDPSTWFTTALNTPVFVENDANAAAMSERVSGVARNLSHFAYLYFGAGLGLGIVSGGQVQRGAFGNAGEIGHITVPVSGGAGVLERHVSRRSVQEHLADAGISAATGNDLAKLYDDADPVLMRWLENAARPLSHAIAIVENLFDPQTVVLGGAMPDKVLDHLIAQTTLSPRSVSNRADRALPRMMRGTGGRMSATLGAAALVLNQSFTPRIVAS